MVFIKLTSSALDMTVDDIIGPNVVLNALDKLFGDEIGPFSVISIQGRFIRITYITLSESKWRAPLGLANQRAS